LDDGDPLKDNVIHLLGSWHYGKTQLSPIFDFLDAMEVRTLTDKTGWAADGSYNHLIHVTTWKKSHDVVLTILEALHQSLVVHVQRLLSLQDPLRQVTVEDVTTFLQCTENDNDYSFQCHKFVMFVLEAYVAMMGGIDDCHAEMHDCGRIILLFLFAAYHNSLYVRDGIFEIMMVLFQFTPDLKDHREKFFSIVDASGVGKAYDFLMEIKNDVLQEALPNGLVNENGVDRASLYMDVLPMIKKKLDSIYGITNNGIRNDHTVADYSKAIVTMATHLDLIRFWEIVPLRSVCLGMSGKVIPHDVSPLHVRKVGMERVMENVDRAIAGLPMQHEMTMSKRMLSEQEVVKKNKRKKSQREAREKKKQRCVSSKKCDVEESDSDSDSDSELLN